MLIFAFVPFYSDDNEGKVHDAQRGRVAHTRRATIYNNVTVLDSYGLS